MTITTDQFKDVMRLLPAGVNIVTIKAGDDIHGMTVSAFVSISALPPLVGIILDHRGRGHELLNRPGATFAVNMLTDAQAELSNHFAWSKEDRFAMGNWGTAVTGAPILSDSLGWLDCTIHETLTLENNTIYVGYVEASGLPTAEGRPLLYWNRDYRTL